MSREDEALRRAKEDFTASLAAADPRRIVGSRPFSAVGWAVVAGITVALSGKKIARAFFPGPRLVADVIKSIIK